ncbi:hypothetical protein CBF45_16835 [Bordetella sp. J329]|nr:hypothetical protein CBF45_16835 [Bordetella sp. J329]
MATLNAQDEYIKTALRLPRDLHKQVQESATERGRSMNAEIIERLAMSFRLPNHIDNVMAATEALNAVHNEQSDLVQRLIQMYEAQKVISDQQQAIIADLLQRDA